MKVKTKACRHGTFSFYEDDEFVGRSLDLYGEFSEGEVELFKRVLRPGDVAIDVGANIGALTIPMARMAGTVHAFEPQPDNYRLLSDNVCGNLSNILGNVVIHPIALGVKPGTTAVTALDVLTHRNYGRIELVPSGISVEMRTIDSFNFDKVKLIKIDAEGSELEVLKGARETITRCRPYLYVENDRPENEVALIDYLKDDLCYNLWWHLPPLYSPNNFRRNRVDVFPRIVSKNMFCAHESIAVDVVGLDEIIDSKLDAGTYDRMIRRYQRQLDANPDALDIRTQMGYLLALLHREEEAEAAFTENLRRDPDNKRTRYVSSILPFHRGDYQTAWPLAELRYEMPHPELWGHRHHNVPPWDGQSTDDVVLISAEQGFGDNIMHIRFWRDVLSIAPNAIFECQPQLYELFQQSGVAPLYRRGRTLPRYDKWCALTSIPARWNLSVEQISGSSVDVELIDVPYLTADAALIERWKHTIPDGVQIGLCWQGSPNSERGFTRDIPISLFKPMTDQFDYVALSNVGQFESYADTAACIACLDLVISVDTSIAHLAGAMGKEVWLLCPLDSDWRWIAGSETSPWYPTMRVFQQTQLCNWQGVLERVMAALCEKSGLQKAA